MTDAQEATKTENQQCSICLDDVTECSQVVLPCKHAFHGQCIINHFRRGDNRCPNCRDTGRVEVQEQDEEREQTSASRRNLYRTFLNHLCRHNAHFGALRRRAVAAHENMRRRRALRMHIQREIRQATPHLHNLLQRTTRQMDYHFRRWRRHELQLVVQSHRVIQLL